MMNTPVWVEIGEYTINVSAITHIDMEPAQCNGCCSAVDEGDEWKQVDEEAPPPRKDVAVVYLSGDVPAAVMTKDRAERLKNFLRSTVYYVDLNHRNGEPIGEPKAGTLPAEGNLVSEEWPGH